MLSFKRKAVFLLFASLFIFLLSFTIHFFYDDLVSEAHLTKTFQKKLLQKEAEVDAILSYTMEIIQVSDSVPDFQMLTTKLDEFDLEQVTVCVFKSDTLIYWSDNNIQMVPDLPSNNFDQNVLYLSNGWFELRKIIDHDFTIFGFIKIKMIYPYENEHLSNSFAGFLNIPDEIRIQSNPLINNIHNGEGEYLFSLDFSTHSTIPKSLETMLSLLFILSYLLFISSVYYGYKLIGCYFKNRTLLLLGLIADILIIRFLLLYFNFPDYIDHAELFYPEFYASSFWSPSLGDLFLNLGTLFTIGYSLFHFVRIDKIHDHLSIKQRFVVSNLFIVFISAGFYLLTISLQDIVINSNISFNLADITSISFFSIAGFLCFGLYLFIFVLFAYKPALFIFSAIESRTNLLLLFLLYGALFLAGFYVYLDFKVQNWLFLILFFTIIWYIFSQKGKNILFSSTVLLIMLFSMFSTFSLNQSVNQKERANRSILADKLLNQIDPILEYKFSSAARQIQTDSVLHSMLEKFPFEDFSSLNNTIDYIFQKYFSSFSAHSEVWLTLCDSTGLLDLQPEGVYENCFEYFSMAIDDYGKSTEFKNLFFIDNIRNEDNYLGIIEFTNSKNELRLFVEIFNKYIHRGIGYPELLVDKKDETGIKLSEYSYCRYENGIQFNQYGSFIYALNLIHYNLPGYSTHFFNRDGYNHLLYAPDRENAILVSTKNPGLIDLIAPFSYISIFLGMMTLVFYVLFRGIGNFKFDQVGFKKRLQFSITVIIVVSFLFVGVGSLFYIITLNRNKNISILQEKSNSVLIELKHKLEDKDELPKEMESYLSNLLVKFSQVFFTDINLYDPEGQLLATSRHEVFRKGLVSKMVNSTAFLNMHNLDKSLFIHEEKIGEYAYLSAYMPFRNKASKMIAYLNLPYFAKQDELTNEISTFLVAFINVYVILIAISIYLALVISNYITKPIELIREKIGKLKLGKTVEKIEWKRQDEIGSLVAEYNRMVDELEQSAALLARSERESAWREMAKQIAHEIKNPLTPMKLSVQYLQKAWDEKAPDWDERLKRFSNTLIEQINSLSIIASEFSDFAKMPRSNFQHIDLADIITNAIGIFKSSSHINFEFTPGNKYYVFADKEQLLRVFNNLIKNSIQAIPVPEEGLIKIVLSSDNTNHYIHFEDNGKGIPIAMQEKIFYPSFTTKSGGMGLGLAMAKNIIENSSGTISFESKEAVGSTFVISLPKAESENG